MLKKKKTLCIWVAQAAEDRVKTKTEEKITKELRRSEVELRSQNTMFGDRKKSPRAENILRAAIKYAMKLETQKAC